MNNTTPLHRIVSTSLILVASIMCSASPAAETPIPPMPNACAEAVCPVIRASAVLACAETNADPDTCESVLVELQRCFDQCSDSRQADPGQGSSE